MVDKLSFDDVAVDGKTVEVRKRELVKIDIRG